MIMEKNVPFLFPYRHITTFPSFPWTLVDHMTLQAEMISITCGLAHVHFAAKRYFPKRTIGAHYYSANSSFSPLLPGWTFISPAGYKGPLPSTVLSPAWPLLIYTLLHSLPSSASPHQINLMNSYLYFRIKPCPRFCTAVIETIIRLCVPRFLEQCCSVFSFHKVPFC